MDIPYRIADIDPVLIPYRGILIFIFTFANILNFESARALP